MACVHLHLHLHFYRLLLHVSLTYHFFRIYMIPDAISRRAGTSHEKERSKEVFIKNPDAVSRFGNLIANEISVRFLLGSGTLMSSRCVRDSLYIYYQTSSLLFIDGFCTPVSLVLQDRKDKSFLFNVVDTPGKKKMFSPAYRIFPRSNLPNYRSSVLAQHPVLGRKSSDAFCTSSRFAPR